MSRYYEAQGETLKKLVEFGKAREAAVRRVRKFCREIGAKEYATNGFHSHPTWFSFKEPPDKKVWKKHKDAELYAPRLSTKAGVELHARMTKLHIPGGDDVAKIIGMKTFGAMGGGIGWRTPGLHVFGKRYIVTVPDDVTPKGCKRISDVEYERLSKKRKPRDHKDAAGT